MMKKYVLSYFFFLFVLCGCKDDGNLFFFVPPTEQAPDDTEEGVPLFDEYLDLEYPGLAKVREAYAAGDMKKASEELLEYFRSGKDYSYADVDFEATPNLSDFQRNIADQTLEYRLYVKGFYERIEGGKEIYYSRLIDGKVDWKTRPETVTSKEYLYQLHRFQWENPLLTAYRHTKDDKYVQSWMRIYSDWMDAFPAPEGKVDNSSNMEWYGLQPAERLRGKVGVLPYFVRSESMTPEFLVRILTLMYEEAESIRQNYHQHNFLVSQILSISKMGILMPEFKNAAIWEAEAFRKADEEIRSQFLPDGVHVEVTPGYHISTLFNMYDVYTLAQKSGKLSKFSQEALDRIKNAARFIMDLTYPGYGFDNFNDTGSSSYNKRRVQGYFEDFLKIFPDEEEFKWMATEGAEGTMPSAETKLYTWGGYYMMRSKWWDDALMMVVKNNNTYGVDLGHCHCDNGTFSLFNKGRNFSPDAGYYDYGVTDPDIADYIAREYDATNAHNTMTRNDENIPGANRSGEFLMHEKKDGYEVLVTQNPSYSDLTHRRAVFFVDKKFFVIVDEGYGNANGVSVKLTFHLADDKNVTIDKDASNHICGSHTTHADNNNMMFKTFVETSQGYTTAEGVNHYSNSTRTESGTRKWYRVGIVKQRADAARFITVVCPFSSSLPNVSASFTDNAKGAEGTFHEEGASVKVTVDGKNYDLSYKIQAE